MTVILFMLAIIVVVDAYLIFTDRRDYKYKRQYFLKPKDLL